MSKNQKDLVLDTYFCIMSSAGAESLLSTCTMFLNSIGFSPVMVDILIPRYFYRRIS